MKHSLRAFFCAFLGLFILTNAPSTAQAAIAKPVLSITKPTASTRASNEVFTVTGKASGGAGVTNVFYSLNSSAWTDATQVGSWSNWTAQVTLIPGTNVLSAFAVDTNGIRSATNTVRFIYVVLAPMTVNIHGNLTVSPNYNGKLLQLGRAYTMSGQSPVKGFGVLNWTDANSNVVHVGSSIRFIMVTNLSLTANFGDIQVPTIALVRAYTNHDGIPNKVFISGTASDNVGVAGVYFQLNGGAWQLAQFTTNHWRNWVAELDNLQSGLNQFSARSFDTSSNHSYIISAQIKNTTTPVKLASLTAYVQPADASAFYLTFSTSTFSQRSQNEDQPNGVGTYSYLTSGPFAQLKTKYTAPPIAATHDSHTYNLTFWSRIYATYTTTNHIATNLPVLVTNSLVVTTNFVFTNLPVLSSGSMSFSPAPKSSLSSAVNQLILAVNNDGDGVGTFFMAANKYTSFALLSQQTNKGGYTYTAFSPSGGLFKLTGTNGTEYIVANFEHTNYGSYYSEAYDKTNGLTGTDGGRFIVGSQKSGGNAPLSLANRAFQIFSGPDSFNDVFGTNTYSQDSSTTNFDNVVGSYTYSRPNTNIIQVGLTVIAPPASDASNTLAGSSSAARMIFVASNAGLFTNDDGTLSSFVMSTATNFVPARVDSRSFSLRDSSDIYGLSISSLQFTNGNEFYFNGTFRGNYDYTVFSPAAAMVQLNFSTNTEPPGLDWLQLKFTAATNGSYFVNEFDTTNNFQDNAHGTFQGN